MKRSLVLERVAPLMALGSLTSLPFSGVPQACSRPASRTRSWVADIEKQAQVVEEWIRLRKRVLDLKRKDMRTRKRPRLVAWTCGAFLPLASRGGLAHSENIHPKDSTHEDYSMRLTAFLELAHEWKLEVDSRRGLDMALEDYADLK